jgi:steroid 5-alpha reductase family enzyme
MIYIGAGFLMPNIFEGSDPAFISLLNQWLIIMASTVLICFIVSEITGNYSQFDKLWSLIPAVYGWVTFSAVPAPRILLMAVLVTLWGLRLSYNFARKGGYNIIPWRGVEDYRWKVMRNQPLLRGRLRFALFNFFFISLYQNVLVLLFSSPLLLASLYPDKELNAVDFIGGFLMMGFLVLETIADNQLFRFHMEKKRGPADSNRYNKSVEKGFFSEGLWKYMRHPNFTAEQSIWISFYLFGAAASGRWINVTLAGPVLLVLLFIGSTRLTENISSSKYPGYSDYKKRTPVFIPRLLKF